MIIVEIQAQHAYDADQVIEKRFTYNTPSPYQKLIFDEFVDAEFPAGQFIKEILKTNFSLRSKIRLAEALLYRNHLEDIKNNVIIQSHQLFKQNNNNFYTFYILKRLYAF